MKVEVYTKCTSWLWPKPESVFASVLVFCVLGVLFGIINHKWAFFLFRCVYTRRGVLDTTLCDKVCQSLATGRWFSTGTPVSSTNKTDRHDISELLLKMTLSTINHTIPYLSWIEWFFILLSTLAIQCTNGEGSNRTEGRPKYFAS